MTLAQHEFADGWCLHCGARQRNDPNLDQRTCLLRETPKSELAPEPKRREYAAEDAEVIGARLAELRKTMFPDPEPQQDYGDCCG